MRTITVSLGDQSYPIHVGISTLSSIGSIYSSFSLPRRIAVITDRNVAALYLRQLVNTLRHQGLETVEIVIPPGERQKSFPRARSLYEELLGHKIKRDAAVMALGGGVVGDIAGFVAATYRRGLPVVQVPTTLLGQVESAIGGKVGINLSGVKNAVGAFHQPAFVFSDVNLLSTLPKREIICGIGEILKYGYLSEEMFSFLDQYLEDILGQNISVMEETVVRCNLMKARMISEDERETMSAGGRTVLNLGHTIGHALEVLSNYRLRHGEAVVIGLKWELMLAKEAGLINDHAFGRLQSLLARVHFAPRLDFLTRDTLIRKIFGSGRTAKFILPKAIGSIETIEIDSSLVRSVLKNKNDSPLSI